MDKSQKWISALLLAAVCAGCITSQITNLTATQLPRNTTGLYRVEMIWDSNQEALLPETIKAEVQVLGHNATYPMKRTPLLTNRWETIIGPLSPTEKEVRYRIKVQWKFNAIPEPSADSQITRQHLLRIID